MGKVLIIGGGAAGMAASIAAAECGHEVHVYEKNEKLGKKLFITGKGRCNVTNACDMEDMIRHIVTNSRFLYSSFYGFTNQDIMELLEKNGCPLKVERGNRVFPVSDKSSDVISALARQMKTLGVQVHLHSEVRELIVEEGVCKGIHVSRNSGNNQEEGRKEEIKTRGEHSERNHSKREEKILGDAVIVATGGLSYESTGSTGDGYRFAREQGHKVTTLLPALVPFNANLHRPNSGCAIKQKSSVDAFGISEFRSPDSNGTFRVKEPEIKELQGLSLRNIEAVIWDGKKELYREFGELLFTHFGVSGPVILSASSFVAKILKKKELTLSINLKPALGEAQLDTRILKDFEECSNKQFKNALGRLYPAKLIPVIIARSKISPDKKIHEITREERQRLVEITRNFMVTLTGLRDYKEAIITQGGIAVKEIDPGTMESKLVKNLHFAGEVLDLDGVTGGFNLQIAWSTGWAAGSHILV